jgi:hypothetical protein
LCMPRLANIAYHVGQRLNAQGASYLCKSQ